MKYILTILITAALLYIIGLGKLNSLTSQHRTEIAALQQGHKAAIEELNLQITERDHALEEADQEARALIEVRDGLVADLDALRAKGREQSEEPKAPTASTPAPASDPSAPSFSALPPMPSAPPPSSPALPSTPQSLNPSTPPPASTLRLAALQTTLAEAKRTLREWQTKAADEEAAWQSKSGSGVRQSAHDRQIRRDQVAAAIATKQAEVDSLTQQIAALR